MDRWPFLGPEEEDLLRVDDDEETVLRDLMVPWAIVCVRECMCVKKGLDGIVGERF